MAHITTKGTLLQLEIASTYTTIGQRVSIDGPQTSVTEVEVTDLDSTIVETVPGLPDPGSISFTCYLDWADAAHDDIFGFAGSPSVEQWRLVFPTTTPTNLSFDGYVTAWSPTGLEANGMAQFNATIRLTSFPVKS